MKLHGYFRSSAAYRVRIALNLKDLAFETVPVHLLRDGGEQLGADFLKLNPQGLVPAFEDSGALLTQSLAIVEYLEETHPEPALLPTDPIERARVRALALAIACDIHPLNNLRVLNYISGDLGQSDESRLAWYRHWTESGLAAVEALVAGHSMTGIFCHGDKPGYADTCLVPQIANARRFDCDLSRCPELVRIDSACNDLPAFSDAAPQNQPDAE
jgi:maleylpyruvate isomerase